MNSSGWEIIIGLEVHVELATKSKIFCSCTTEFGGEANTHCCPICMGMPGTLPVLNEKVLEFAVKTGLALNCGITRYNKFDRKNYYYPDLPKAYQISQLYLPSASGGHVDIQTETGVKSIGIHEIHMEEDAGKLVHSEKRGVSYPDYNRCGVPLLEIVSEPDFRSAEEVIAYLEKVKLIFEYLEISDCKMEEGSMRVDVNLSVRRYGDENLGVRTETKNLNSFRAIKRAIAYESLRQTELLESGGKIVQQTRRWDDDAGTGHAMRSKENAQDYRYFPEPDIPPLLLSEDFIADIKSGMPELAEEKKQRYIKDYGLSEYDAKILTENKRLSEIFEETAGYCNNAKETANWLIVEFLSLIKNDGAEIKNTKIDCKKIASLIKAVTGGVITRPSAKDIFAKIYSENIEPEQYIKENKLDMVSDSDLLYKLCEEAIAEDPSGVQKYKNGNAKVFAAFVGSVMKKMKGKANTAVVNDILKDMLEKK